MTAPAPSIHKKIIFVAAGCATVLAVFTIIAVIGLRKMGFETPAAPRYATPQEANAAVDSLSRVDFSQWLHPAGAFAALRCREPWASQRVAPVPAADSLSPRIGFGDTFPPGSAARRMWEGFGRSVNVEAAEDGTTPPDSLPPGGELLAALRLQLNQQNSSSACVILDALVEKVRALESDPRLDRIVAGVWLGRDAADMVARDTNLQAFTGLTPAQADALLATLDARKHVVLDVRTMIDAAGASPASADSLVAWAQDERLPLPVRHADVEAIGYGWVLDPPEMTFSVNGARLTALDRLLRDTIPDDLRRTARDARAVMQRNLAQRFQFAVTYRTRRELVP